MGCGSVKTLDTENKNKNENKEENQIIEIKKEKNSNQDDEINEISIEKENKILNASPQKEDQNQNILKSSKKSKVLMEDINTSKRTFKPLGGNSSIIISSVQKSLPKIEEKIVKVDDIEKKFFEFEAKASRFDILYPIWLIKDEQVEFSVEGKWNVNDEIECDSKGVENPDVGLFPERINEYLENNEIKYNDGALVGRIIKGNNFLIYDGLKYTPEESGALLLKMNLNNLWSKNKPFGKLKIRIYGAYKIEDIDDLEKRNGWWNQLKMIEYLNEFELEYYEMNDTEKSLVILLNKLRHDSCAFAKQYLTNFEKMTNTTKQIYNQLISNNKQYIPLKVNLTMVKLLQTFYEKIFYKEETPEEDWNYVLDSEKRLQEFLEESFCNKKKVHAAVVRYYDENIMHVCSRLLFRKEIRDNLLTYEYEEMSMITLYNNWNNMQSEEEKRKKNIKNIYYCVCALSNQNGNDKINYDVDKSFAKFIKEEKQIKFTLDFKKNIL